MRSDGVEILVIEHGSDVVPVTEDDRVQVIVDDRPMPCGRIRTKIGTTLQYDNAFCKARLLNLGIEHAKGEVITILDADAIVGIRWACCAEMLQHTNIHRVAYRVRYLKKEMLPVLYGGDRNVIVSHCFANYDDHRVGWEAYGHPQYNHAEAGGRVREPEPGAQPWGNSQFSMRRDDIGDLRYDEGYVGKGLEDIDFNRQIHDQLGKAFRGEIFTHAEYAMFHLQHDYDEANWGDPTYSAANADRYTAKGSR
jgi:hypothetical protein